jgi:hypothetical protein
MIDALSGLGVLAGFAALGYLIAFVGLIISTILLRLALTAVKAQNKNFWWCFLACILFGFASYLGQSLFSAILPPKVAGEGMEGLDAETLALLRQPNPLAAPLGFLVGLLVHPFALKGFLKIETGKAIGAALLHVVFTVLLFGLAIVVILAVGMLAK